MCQPYWRLERLADLAHLQASRWPRRSSDRRPRDSASRGRRRPRPSPGPARRRRPRPRSLSPLEDALARICSSLCRTVASSCSSLVLQQDVAHVDLLHDVLLLGAAHLVELDDVKAGGRAQRRADLAGLEPQDGVWRGRSAAPSPCASRASRPPGRPRCWNRRRRACRSPRPCWPAGRRRWRAAAPARAAPASRSAAPRSGCARRCIPRSPTGCWACFARNWSISRGVTDDALQHVALAQQPERELRRISSR